MNAQRIGLFRGLAPLLLLAPAVANGDALVPEASEALPTIRIAVDSVEPARTRLSGEGDFVMANTTAATARIEFRVPRGEGLDCTDVDGAVQRGRKFVIGRGETLACRAAQARTDYTVFRAVRSASGSFRQHRTDARIDLR